jgi:hypothetical protein
MPKKEIDKEAFSRSELARAGVDEGGVVAGFGDLRGRKRLGR